MLDRCLCSLDWARVRTPAAMPTLTLRAGAIPCSTLTMQHTHPPHTHPCHQSCTSLAPRRSVLHSDVCCSTHFKTSIGYMDGCQRWLYGWLPALVIWMAASIGYIWMHSPLLHHHSSRHASAITLFTPSCRASRAITHSCVDCSISSAATKNVVLAAAIKSASSMVEVRRVFADVAAGRYGAPVSMHVANGTEYYPEVLACAE